MSFDGQDPTISGVQVVSAAPRAIADLVKSCREYVRLATQMDLDTTPETLPILDHYVVIARESLEERPEVLPLLAGAIGAYFGEVTRRALDGFWVTRGDQVHDWVICGRQAFISVNPFGVAYEALLLSTATPGPPGAINVSPEDKETVAKRLASLPEVRDDEYFLMSTRIEVIEIAAEALRGEMIEGGTAGVEFTEDDYFPEKGGK